MFCYKCGNTSTRVLDSRSSEDGKIIRRRRECENCQNRFTTYEKLEVINLIVEKSGNRRERYNRVKLIDSILKATNKRNISMGDINAMVSTLEVKWNANDEVSSKTLGNDILQALRELDEIAYIRYASVYLDFKTANDFVGFIQKK